MPDQQVSQDVITIPNVLTFVRLGLIPLFVILYVTRTSDPVSFAILFAIGFTDWLDGFLARRMGQISALGKLLDPVADRIAVVAVLLALLFRGTLPTIVAGAILLRDLLIAVAFAVLESRKVPRIDVNLAGKAATFLIYSGLGFSVLAGVVDVSGVISSAALAMLWVGAVLYWVAGVLYAARIRRVLIAEREI